MLALTLFYNLPLMGVILFTGLGHVVDVAHPVLKKKLLQKIKYQKMSEDLIFFMSYSIFYINLDLNKSIQTILQKTVVDEKDRDSVTNLVRYYVNVYFPKNYGKTKSYQSDLDVRINRALDVLKVNSGDNILFFSLIESMVNSQISNPTESQIKVLKNVASLLNINYLREYEEQPENYRYEKEDSSKNNDYEYVYEENINNSSDNDYREDDRSSKSYSEDSSDDIKNAFKELGLKVSKDESLINAKRAYKNEVKKYHPDILKAKGLSDKKIKEAEAKLIELNKSIDIVKKFLANA